MFWDIYVTSCLEYFPYFFHVHAPHRHTHHVSVSVIRYIFFNFKKVTIQQNSRLLVLNKFSFAHFCHTKTHSEQWQSHHLLLNAKTIQRGGKLPWDYLPEVWRKKQIFVLNWTFTFCNISICMPRAMGPFKALWHKLMTTG